MNRATQQRRDARRRLHNDRAVAALYLATETAEPLAVTVRVQTQFGALGRPAVGEPAQYAERQEAKPKIIFSADEITFVRGNAIVSVAAGEAYRVELADPRDDTTITATVTRIAAAELTRLSLPVPA